MMILGVGAISVASADDAIRRLAGELARRGEVTHAYADAVVAREAVSPTGLPLAAGSIAVPHADGDHVLSPAVAVALAEPPVSFRQMGNPDITLAVNAVFLLALKTREEAQAALVTLLASLQTARDATELRARAEEFIRKGSIA